MSINPKKIDTHPDEIDLLALLERTLAFLKKYRWLFLAALLLGSGWAVYQGIRQPAKYNSSLLLHPEMVTNQEEIQLVADWNERLKKKQYAQLSATLLCDEATARQTLQIGASEIQKVFTPVNPSGLLIEVTVRDNAVLPALQAAILSGFENSVYVKQRLAAKKSRIRELIRQITAEIQELDSTQQRVTSILGGHASGSATLLIDGSNLYKQRIDMVERLLSLREELQFSTGAQLLRGFQPSPSGVQTHWLFHLAVGWLVAFSLAWLYAMIREVNIRLRRRAGEKLSPLPQ